MWTNKNVELCNGECEDGWPELAEQWSRLLYLYCKFVIVNTELSPRSYSCLVKFVLVIVCWSETVSPSDLKGIKETLHVNKKQRDLLIDLICLFEFFRQSWTWEARIQDGDVITLTNHLHASGWSTEHHGQQLIATEYCHCTNAVLLIPFVRSLEWSALLLCEELTFFTFP